MKVIKLYEYACEQIVEEIKEKYFREDEPDEIIEHDWLADQVGGVVKIGNYYLNMGFMITALRYNATEKIFFDYYEKNMGEEEVCNFENYIKYYKGFNKK